MAKCETTCRDEIYGEIRRVDHCLEKKADRAGIWKSISIVLVALGLLWAVVTWATADGTKLKAAAVEENKKVSSENRSAISDIRQQTTIIGVKVELMQKANEELSKSVKDLLKEIRNDKASQPHR